MNQTEILKEFKEAGAILEGHFILSSGLHSDTYLQCARVLMDAKRSERVCQALVQKISAEIPAFSIDMVVSPALGGVVVGYEMGRQLNIPAIFCERVNGAFTLRRGFNIASNANNILIVEDVITTGKSSQETLSCIEQNGGKVVAVASLIDRSDKIINLGIPIISLLKISVANYQSDNLPERLKTLEPIKPGSRTLQSLTNE